MAQIALVSCKLRKEPAEFGRLYPVARARLLERPVWLRIESDLLITVSEFLFCRGTRSLGPIKCT